MHDYHLNHIPKKDLRAIFTGNRQVGTPRKRWEDVVKKGLQLTSVSQLEPDRAQQKLFEADATGCQGSNLSCRAIG